MKKILLSAIITMTLIACKENTEKPNATSSEKAKIDFKSNETAKAYKTAILESYKDGKVNFAGNYIITTWGCGTSCISGAMVDVRDGKIYDLPSDDEWDGIEALEKYWNWNEANKKFEFIKMEEVKTENQK